MEDLVEEEEKIEREWGNEEVRLYKNGVKVGGGDL